MDVKEAIRIIHPDTSALALCEYEYYGGFNGKEAQIKAINEASVILCEVAEKQIPKKPNTDKWNGINGVPYKKCPNCNGLVCGSRLDRKKAYCENCGQKLDWSEENE